MRCYLIYIPIAIKKLLVQIASEKDYDADKVGTFLIHKVMLLHLGARMLLNADWHMHHYRRQLDSIMNYAKPIIEKCGVQNDLAYLSSVLASPDRDTDLDVSKLSPKATEIYTNYFLRINELLPERYVK